MKIERYYLDLEDTGTDSVTSGGVIFLFRLLAFTELLNNKLYPQQVWKLKKHKDVQEEIFKNLKN